MLSRAAATLALAAVLAWTAAGAAAQDRRDAPGRGGEPGRFDFYVLALSWSPGYCAGAGRSRASEQCEPGRRLGFVVHGLWPQYERGFPSECGADRFVPQAALAEAEGVYPERRLAIYEWRKHGTCSGLSPSAYFRAARTARDKVAIPDPLAALARDGETTPQTIERAFGAVNPGLRPDMMSVQCSRGDLQEVRVCLSKDLREFRSCPDVDRRSCRFGPIRVTAPR